LRREGFRYRAVIDWRDPELRKVLLLMGPGTIGVAATQVNVFVNTLLATSEGTGAVSWLTYAFRLIYLPIGLFGVSIATAVLPALSRYAAIDDVAGVRDTLLRGVSLMLMLSVPATVGLIVLATPIVQLLFQHGRFLAADTTPTAAALRFYALGLIGYSTARIAAPAFYAVRQSRVPAAVSVVTIAANIVLSVAFQRTLGFRGLALGTSLAALANGGLLMLLLRRRLDGMGGSRLAVAFAKIVAASMVMAAVVAVVERGAGAVAAGDGIGAQSVRLLAAIGAGVAALAGAARVLAIAEFRDAAAMVRARLAGWRDA
jgi:putative peptidoglycan lipid II flippase